MFIKRFAWPGRSISASGCCQCGPWPAFFVMGFFFFGGGGGVGERHYAFWGCILWRYQKGGCGGTKQLVPSRRAEWCPLGVGRMYFFGSVE